MSTDPMKQAWNEVAEQVSSLGHLLREKYRHGDEAARSEASEASEELRSAIDRLVAAGREVGDRVSDAARDDDVKDQAKHAAGSLDQALTATVDLISAQLSSLLGKKSDDPPTPPETPSQSA